jgi:hypothetical protein
MPGLILALARDPVALECARPDGLAVLLPPYQVDVDHLAKGLCGSATALPDQHLGLEPGLDPLRLFAAAVDLAADLPLAACHRVDARVDDDLEAVAAGTDHDLP